MKVLEERRVVDGRVEVSEGHPKEGASVIVLVDEGESDFTLSRQEVAELQKSIDQASRGEVVDGWQLLEELRGQALRLERLFKRRPGLPAQCSSKVG